MPRVALIVLALFTSIFVVLAAPIPVPDGPTLETRTTHNGRGTWFEVGLGNCGYTDHNNAPVVAVAESLYNANHASNCNQWIEITANGKTAYGQTRDSCPSCGTGDLDMSPSLFQKFAGLDVGKLEISWHFMSKSWRP